MHPEKQERDKIIKLQTRRPTYLLLPPDNDLKLRDTLEQEFSGKIIDIDKLYKIAAWLILGYHEDDGWSDIRKNENIYFRTIASCAEVLSKDLEEQLSISEETASLELSNPRIEELSFDLSRMPNIVKIIWRWVDQKINGDSEVILLGDFLRDASSFNEMNFNLISLNPNSEGVSFEDGFTEVGLLGLEISVIGEIVRKSIQTEDEVRNNRIKFQKENEIQRSCWKWGTNPLLVSAKNLEGEPFDLVVAECLANGVGKLDLMVQVMTHLASFKLEEVWTGDKEILDKIFLAITSLEFEKIDAIFNEAISKGEIYLNQKLIEEIYFQQAKKLIKAIKNAGVEEMTRYMVDPSCSPFGPDRLNMEVDNRKRVIVDPNTKEENWHLSVGDKEVIFKRVDPKINKALGNHLHYLHAGREGIASYGVFLEGDEWPFAWYSFSDIDRDYLRNMCNHIGINPKSLVTITRGWNSSWSPQNTMSVLLSYSHHSLKQMWETSGRSKKHGLLVGLSTAVNPNLGFGGHFLRGAGYFEVGTKPAGFTYLIDPSGSKSYMTRRTMLLELGLPTLEELKAHPQYATAKMPLLPTWEMLALFSPQEQERVMNKPIYVIPNEDHG